MISKTSIARSEEKESFVLSGYTKFIGALLALGFAPVSHRRT